MGEFFLIVLGSLFAFIFAFVLYVYQKKTNEGQYLSFTISYIVSQVSQLYALKKDHLLSRNTEAVDVETKIKGGVADLAIKEMSNILSNPQHSSSSINLEKLAFLADFDPNLLVLTKAALDADKGVDEIITNCNLQIKAVKEATASNGLSEIWLLVCFNRCLYDQVDHALALMEHTQKQLIQYAQNEFKHFTIISGCEIDEKYAALSPKSTNSLLDIVYCSKKITFLKKIKKVLSRFCTCF